MATTPPATLSSVRVMVDPEILDALEGGSLMLCVGPGPSVSAGLPSTEELAQGLLARACEFDPSFDRASLERWLAKGQVAEVLEQLQRCLGRDFQREVEERLSDTDRPVPPLLHAIARLREPLRAIYTTRLDRLLERALGGDWPSFSFDAPSGALAQSEAVLVKLRGTLERPSSWVLTRAQEQREFGVDGPRRDLLEVSFRAHHLLFVGFELGSMELETVLDMLPTRADGYGPTHFIVLPACGRFDRVQLESRGLRVILADALALLDELAERHEAEPATDELPDTEFVYDAAADFSRTSQNPNGVWSYGFGSKGGDFTLIPDYSQGDTTIVRGGGPDGGKWRGFRSNLSNGPVKVSGTVDLNAGALMTHPGKGIDPLTKLRFCAPSAGRYAIEATWTNIDRQHGAVHNEIAVYTNAAAARGTTVPDCAPGFEQLYRSLSEGSLTRTHFSHTLELDAGELLSFELGPGASYSFSSVELELTVTKLSSASAGRGLEQSAAEPRAAEDVYDLAADFSRTSQNPNGVWSYGFGSHGGDFTLTPDCDRDETTVVRSGGPGGGRRGFYYNLSNGPVKISGTVDLNAGALMTHPGKGIDPLTKVRFRAPSAGRYAIEAIWTNIDRQHGSVHNEISVYTNAAAARGVVLPNSPPGFKQLYRTISEGSQTRKRFRHTLELDAGEVLSFELGPGASYAFSSVELELRLTKL